MNTETTQELSGAVCGRLDALVRRYSTIVVDPPWPGPGAAPTFKRDRKQVVIPYTTMTGVQVASLNIHKIATQDAQLFLWATSRSIGDAFLLCQSWGFNFRGFFIWRKPLGMGRHVRNQAEFVVWGGRKGAPLVAQKECPHQIHDWKKPKGHSEKPDEAYKLFERLGNGPRIDIFARKHREGWDVFGNEIDERRGLCA